MSRFTFLHAADLHLDTPFAGLGRIDESLGERLRDASLAAWERLVDTAIDRQVAFVILAGDIYDGAERGLRAQLGFRDGCARLAADNIPVFIVHGNHDPIGGWSAIRAWPEGVTIFPAGRVDAVPVQRYGQTIATIHGISFDRPDVHDNLALQFPTQRVPQGGFQVGVLHCSVGDSGEHTAYAPCRMEDLHSRAIDYWALGHVHGRSVLSQSPAVVYSGCVQGRSPKPGETGAKGAVLVSVADTRVTKIDPIDLAEIVFDETTVDIGDLAGVDDLIDTLCSQASEFVYRAPGGAILTARLTGSGPLYDDLRRPGARDDLLRRLRETTAAPDGRLLWWRSIRDDTIPSIDWDALRDRDDLVGEIVRRGDQLLEDPTAAAALTEKAWPMGDNLARRTPGSEERDRLMAEAIRLAILSLEYDR